MPHLEHPASYTIRRLLLGKPRGHTVQYHLHPLALFYLTDGDKGTNLRVLF